jgi:hypothetical protein
VLGIRVNHIRLQRLAADLHPERKDRGADIDNEPVCVFLGGPAVDEKAERCKDRSGQHDGHAKFRQSNTVGGVFEPAENEIDQWAADFCTTYLADA